MFNSASVRSTLATLMLLAPLAASSADYPAGVALYTPEEMHWADWGVSAQRAVLAGDPNHRGCSYTDRVKFLANTKVAAHALPEDKLYTVISGTLYVGIGDQWEESRLRKMPPGSFWTIPANVSRYFKNDVEVIFQSTAMPGADGKACIDAASKTPKK